MPRQFPELSDCDVLICVNAALVPLLAGKLGELEQRGQWASESDWEQGEQWAAELQECMVSNCAGQSITEMGALLALALGLNEANTEQVEIAFPAIAAKLADIKGGAAAALLTKSPNYDTVQASEQVSAVLRLEELVRTFQGQLAGTGALWWYEPGHYTQLSDLYEQGGGLSELSDPEGVDWLDYLTDLLGLSDDILDLLNSLGISPGTLKKDGLMLLSIAIQTANLAANAQIPAMLAGYDWANRTSGAPAGTNELLNALLTSQRGQAITFNEASAPGAALGQAPDVPAPGDSVLQALRGNTEASATRNVIDAITTAAPDMTNVEALLTAISSDTAELAGIKLDTAGLADIQAVVDDLLSGTSIAGKTNLYSLWLKLDSLVNGSGNELTELQAIVQLLVNLMSETDVNGRITLYELLQKLDCICESSLQIVRQMELRPAYGFEDAQPELAAAQPDMCQRARWLVAQLRNVSSSLMIGIEYSDVNAFHVEDTYERQDPFISMGVGIGFNVASGIASYMNQLRRSDPFAASGTLNTFWNDNESALICAIFQATNSQEAYTAWYDYCNTFPYTNIASRVVRNMIPMEALNRLFAGNLPLDPRVLNDYSSDCSGCSGGGTPGPTAPPGGWDYTESYMTATPGGSNVHPVYGWQAVLLGKAALGFPTLQGLAYSDKWTISTDLRYYKVIDSKFHATGFDILVYDQGSLIQTIPAGTPATDPAAMINSSTSSVVMVVVTNDASSAGLNLHNPSEGSGY